MDLDLLRRLYAYHHWATDSALDAISPVTAEQLDRPWGGSFGSGRALLNHVVGVERLWLERWNGRSPKAIPAFGDGIAGRGFRVEWEKVRDDQQGFLTALSAERLGDDLTYVNLKGERWTYPFADILTHVVNHGTYHRGQLTHLLRDLGLTAPSTDYLVFIDEQRKR